VIGTSAFKTGQYDTGWLGKFIADWEPPVV
jgi:hypothetical protein